MCAKIIPFKAIRPVRDKAHLVASRPHYTYTKQILNAGLIENPFSFLHVINPEFKKSDKTRPNSIERFEKVESKFQEFKRKEIFIQDDRPCFYLYRQTVGDHAFLGLTVGVSIDDYFEGHIKVHEQTITSREEVFKTYLDVCGFNAEPVLLTHREDPSIMEIYQNQMHVRPEYEFSTPDQIKHEVWVIDDSATIDTLVQKFNGIADVYIADGHHRSASSALLGKQKRESNSDHNGTEGYNSFMAFLIPENRVKIYDFNRLVTEMNGILPENLISALSANFSVKKAKRDFKPTKKHEFSMYLDKKWYRLNLLNEPDSDNPKDHLDPELLSQLILSPIFGITDLKTDPKINFLNGKLGMKGLRKKVDRGEAKIAFGLFPVSVQELMDVADTNNSMPPKSTYIEPKLRSGLTIYEI